MKKYACFLLSLCCLSCGEESEDKGMLHIQMEQVKSNPQQEEVVLEDLNVSIVPIRLETNDECLLNNITQILDEDYLWIVADRQIYKFNHEGKYVGKIGRKGQGPSEYVAPRQIQIDSEQKIVYVMDYLGRKVNTYDYDGNFLHSLPLPDDYSLNRLLFDKGQLYYSSVNNSVKPDLLVCDWDSGKMDTLSFRERMMGQEAFMGDTFFNRVGDETHLYHYFNDTVYSIRGKELLPVYLFDLGENQFTYPQLTMTGDNISEKRIDNPKISISNFIETEKYLFLSYTVIVSWKMEETSNQRFAFYDKDKRKLVSDAYWVSKTQPAFCIESENPIFASADGCSIFTYKQAVDLMEEEIFEGLLEDDNPIVIKYTFQ